MTAAWMCMGRSVFGVMRGCTGMKAMRMMKRHGTALMSRKVEKGGGGLREKKIRE